MRCFRCGWCCENMSPFGSPCPNLEYDGMMAVCMIYSDRPEQCVKEDMGGALECPIGKN